MGESGSPYGRFRRALERRQVTAALSAAAELRHVALTDALELLLLLRDRDRARYARAALRWHGRLCREVPGLTLNEAAAVLALLAALADSADRSPARALAELLNGRALDQPARILVRWAEDVPPIIRRETPMSRPEVGRSFALLFRNALERPLTHSCTSACLFRQWPTRECTPPSAT